VGNWAGVGTATVVQSATYAHGGSYSFKCGTGASDGSANYVTLASPHNPTFVVGRRYLYPFWVYQSSGDTRSVYFRTGGVTSAAFLIPDGTWTLVSFVFIALTATTSLDVWCADDEFFYLDDIGLPCECIEFDVLAEKGVSDPQLFQFWKPLQRSYLDGRMEDQITGIRRRAWFDVGSVHDAEDQKRIIYWLIDNNRSIDWLTENDLPFSLEDVTGFENEWLFDCSLMRAYQFRLVEPEIRDDFPT
jgi:hypothetical protein